MGTIIGNIAHGASPSQEDFRVFETQADLNTYLGSARAKAGQTVKVKDSTTNKYKAYIIQGTAGNFTTVQMGGSYVVASVLPEVANADEDTDYYIGSDANGYIHYKLIHGTFVAVGGDSYSKSEINSGFMALADVANEAVNVPASDSSPNLASSEYAALNDGQIFTCIINEEVTYWIKQSASKCVNISDGGVKFDGGVVDAEGYLHLTLDGVDVIDKIFVGTGGSGSGGSVGINLTNVVKPSSVRNGANAIFSFTAASTDDTNVTVRWYVDNIVAETQSDITSGSTFSFNAKNYLKASDTSVVKAIITSSGGGNLTRQWNITSTAFSLSWGSTISPIMLYTSNESVYAIVNVSAQPTSENIITVSVGNYSASKRAIGTKTLTFEIEPENFAVGVNTVTAVMASAADQTDTTDPISYKIVWGVGATSPVVVLADSALSVSQYDTVNINYLVYDPNPSDGATCTMQIGDNVTRTLTPSNAMQSVAFTPQDYGTKTVSLTYENISTSLTLTISQSEYNIGMVDDGNLRYILDPTGHNNNEADKTSFGNIVFSSGFDWVNGGFLSDDDGDAFVVKKGHRATLPRQLFGDADGNGKTIDISFKIKNSDQYDAVAMQELNNGGLKGIIFRANEGELRLNNTTGQLFKYCEENRIDMSINVESLKDQRVMTVWLDGIPSLANQYSSGTLVQNENPLVIGSDHCDVWIYAIRVYNTELSFKDMIQNYISLASTTQQKIQRCRVNDVFNGDAISKEALHTANPNLTIITIAANSIPIGKSDDNYVDANITIQDGATTLELSSGTRYRLQGTSSLGKVRSAGNLDINFKDSGKTYKISNTSIPVNYINVKVNVASSENANNVCATDEYNRYQPYKVPSRATNYGTPIGTVTPQNINTFLNSAAMDEGIYLFDGFESSSDYASYNEWTAQYHPNAETAETKFSAPIVHYGERRDTIEGKPCAVFFTNTSDSAVWAGSQFVPVGATILYAMGDICNSKKNTEVFGQDGTGEHYTKCCIEVSGNDTPAQQFRATSTFNASADGGKGEWQSTVIEDGETKVKTDYEWRAKPKSSDKSEVVAAWNSAVAWVVSTDTSAATNNPLGSSVTYNGTTYTTDSAAYRLAKFKAEFKNYFAVNSMLYHFLYLEFFAALDNVSKNTFYSYDYDSTENKYLWNICKNYDDDTILGCDNDGKPLGDYGVDFGDLIDGSRSPFNAETNPIWVNIRDGFHNELASLYVSLRGLHAFDAELIISKWDTYQAKRPHAAMAIDAYNKYILPYKTKDVMVGGQKKGYDSDYLASLQGSKTYPRKRFLEYQSKYMDGKYGYYIPGTAITLRANGEHGITENFVVTSYAKTYVSIVVDNGTKVYRKIDTPNGTATFSNTSINANATLYFAPESLIKSVVPLKNTNATTFSASGAVKLMDVTLGDAQSSNTYWDSNTGLSIASPILKTFSIRNVANYSQPLNLSANVELESVDTRGTQAGIITLPSYAPLETVNLNACSGIKAQNLSSTETFTMASGSNLSSVYIENCNSVINNAMLTYLSDAVSAGGNTTRFIRMKGVNWTLDNVDLLVAIAKKWKGYAEDINGESQEIDTPVIIGDVTVPTIRQREYELLTNTFNNLAIHYTTLVSEHKIVFLNENQSPILSSSTGENYIQWVSADGATYEPINAGDVAALTKASSAKYDYTFGYWAVYANNTVGAEFTFGRPLTNDVTLIAVFTSSLRKFTVRWYGYDSNMNANTLLHSVSDVDYGTNVSYDPGASLKYLYKESAANASGVKTIESKVFSQWDKSTGSVKGDIDVNGIYESATLYATQQTINGESKYVFDITDELGNNKSLDKMTYAEILAIIKNGQVDYNNATYTDTNNETRSYYFFEQKDSFDYKMGTDYSFNNVVDDTLVEVDNELYLTGENAVIPTVYTEGNQRKIDLTGTRGEPIRLFEEDKSFTMAIDFQFTNKSGYAPSSGDTLVSCFDNAGDGNDGFKLTLDSSTPKLLWGSTYTKAAQNQMRDIIVLRYAADKQTLYLYSFNSSTSTDGVYGKSATYSTVVRANDLTNTNAPLVFGGVTENNDGTYQISESNQAAGIIHWCKIWYDDLGDDVAKELSSWTRDDCCMQYFSSDYDYEGISYGQYASPYYLAGAAHNSSNRGNASFISNAALRYSHVMNPDNYNAGGWGGYKQTVSASDLTPYDSMYNFSQNRVYYGLPSKLRGLIKQVGIPSTAGNKSTTVNLYNSYMYIPSYNEMFGNGSEGRVISFLAMNSNGWSAKRLYFKDIIVPKDSLTSGGFAKYRTDFTDANEPVFGTNSNKGLYDEDTNPSGVKEGDIWQKDNAIGYIFVSAETMRKKNLNASKTVSKNGVIYGGWISATSTWLRSPSTGNTTTFYYVTSSGASNTSNSANYTVAVLPCFTI